jgi:integrase/recombinase XerD
MLEELQRRNYAQTTISSYIRIMEDFSRRFQRAPNRLGPKHIREYQSELFTKRKFAASTVTVYLAALRFFYTKTLKRAWSTTETPYPKRVFALPTILSQEEVTQLIDAARPALHRTLLMTLYATGLRRAELARLKVTDVDSQRMIVRSGPLHSSRSHLQPPPALLHQPESHLSLAGLRPPERTAADDARTR